METKKRYIAYRCPSCGDLTVGLIGKFAFSADLLRLKCPCGESALDAKIRANHKLEISVPCVYCKKNHNYTVTEDIAFLRERFSLACPYSNMDILHFGDEDAITEDGKRTGLELSDVLKNLEADKLSDIQPQDLDKEDILPDPAVYDTFRFLVKEMEAEKTIDCPCHGGSYDLRFTDDGIQVYCPSCGATHLFPAESVSASEDYLTLDKLELK